MAHWRNGDRYEFWGETFTDRDVESDKVCPMCGASMYDDNHEIFCSRCKSSIRGEIDNLIEKILEDCGYGEDYYDDDELAGEIYEILAKNF